MRRLSAILVLVLACGCASSPPAPPQELPVAASRDYDLLWDITRNVVEKHFDLFVQRKDEGYMLSTYKRGDPLPGGLAGDAQTCYDIEEELLNVIRRQLTVRILEDYPGVYVVHLEVICEREGYVPPEPTHADTYNLYDRGAKTGLRAPADRATKVTWFRLGRDLFLEKALLDRIRKQLDRSKARIEIAPGPAPRFMGVPPSGDNAPAPPLRYPAPPADNATAPGPTPDAEGTK